MMAEQSGWKPPMPNISARSPFDNSARARTVSRIRYWSPFGTSAKARTVSRIWTGKYELEEGCDPHCECEEASEADDGAEEYNSVDKTVTAPSTSKKRTRKKHRHVRTRKSHNEREAEKRAEEKKGGSRLVANATTRVCEGNDRSCLCDGWSGYLRPSVCKQGKWNQRPLQCWNEQFGFWQALQKTEFSHWQITAVYELVDQE